jgi:MFS family permease
LSGRLTERLGARIMTAGGLTLIALGLIITGVAAGWEMLPVTLVGLAMTGAGMGLATGPLFGLAVGAVSTARSGTAAALINVARMVGATLGVALLGTVFSLYRGGPDGLRAAMAFAGLLQLGAAGYLLRAVPAAAGGSAAVVPDGR